MPRVPKDSNSDPLVEATARVCLLPRCPGQVESVERDLASVSSRSFLLHRVQISSQQVYRLLLPPPARKSRPTGITSRTNLYEELCHQATPLGLAHGCHGADGHRYSLLPPPPFGYCATERLCLSVFSILRTQRSCQQGHSAPSARVLRVWLSSCPPLRVSSPCTPVPSRMIEGAVALRSCGIA